MLESVKSTWGGKLEGALKERETKGNVYCAFSIFRSIQHFLAKPRNNEGFEVKVTSKTDMDDAGVGGLNWKNCEHFARMCLPVLFGKSIYIQPGNPEHPVLDMTAIVYYNDFKECPIEVHRIEVKPSSGRMV